MQVDLKFHSNYTAPLSRIFLEVIILASLLMGLLLSENTIAFIWEITDSRLPYIAKVRADPNWGASVIYNPEMCEEAGAACGFFRLHAFAHAHLNHLLLPPEAYPSTLEAEADCWAGKNGNPKEIFAAVQLFLNDNRSPELNITGDPAQRAEIVRACAEQADNWIEEN